MVAPRTKRGGLKQEVLRGVGGLRSHLSRTERGDLEVLGGAEGLSFKADVVVLLTVKVCIYYIISYHQQSVTSEDQS